MPEMDGIEVIRRLEAAAGNRRDYCPLTVIMVTAYDREQLLVEANTVHVDAILTKPVMPSLLFNTLLNIRRPAVIATATHTPALTTAMAAVRFDGSRILLVEDHPTNQQVATEFLKKRGIAVTLARDGTEAVAQARWTLFDAILMDIHMPGMDGLEATRCIRKLPGWENIPIIAMTAAVMPEDRVHCRAAGMVDFLAKPIDPEELAETLQRWLRPHSRDVAAVLPVSTTPLATRISPALAAPELPGFDWAGALRRLDGDRALLERLLYAFVVEQTGTLQALDALFAAQDLSAVARWLHTLRGTAANLGAVELAAAAQQLEREVKAGAEPRSYPNFARTLKQSLAAITALNQEAAAVAASSTPPPAVTVDRATIAALLSETARFIRGMELIPDESLQALQDLARAHWPPEVTELFRHLLRQIDDFDHTGALASVEQLATRLDHRLSPP